MPPPPPVRVEGGGGGNLGLAMGLGFQRGIRRRPVRGTMAGQELIGRIVICH